MFVLSALCLFTAAGGALADDTNIETFLERHWSRPLAAQGPSPEQVSQHEGSLDPIVCGQCHAEQFRDWQTALHARAMGPGLIGQLINMAPQAREHQQDCLRCHAPLAEQADALAKAIDASRKQRPGATVSGSELPSEPHLHGLTCAGCHVRGHERFGPPRRDGSAPDATQNTSLPHRGFTASPAFEDSRFCAACHQFQDVDFALNGKLLENTYEEWKASRYAREGRHCQSCHMPDRRHLWRGIHDPETVRKGVTILPDAPSLDGKFIRASLAIRNSGTGHHFPTYVTPRVVVEIEQIAADGRALPGTRTERILQRKVPLDLSREISDTRLPADGELRLDYRRPRARGAVQLAYRLRVEPDEYYARFYRWLLGSGEAGRGVSLIRQALRQAEASNFVAYEERRPLPRKK